jgi:hypothetical protein
MLYTRDLVQHRRHLWYRYPECTAYDAPNPRSSRVHSATCPTTAPGVSLLASLFWSTLTIGDVCQALLQRRGPPSFGKKRMCATEVGPSDDQSTRVTSHTSFSMAWPPKAGPWSSIHGCAAAVELALVRIACLVAMLDFACSWVATSRSEPRHSRLYYWQPASAFEQLFARLVFLKHRKLPLDEAIGCI